MRPVAIDALLARLASPVPHCEICAAEYPDRPGGVLFLERREPDEAEALRAVGVRLCRRCWMNIFAEVVRRRLDVDRPEETESP